MSVTEQMMMYAEQFNQRIDGIEQFMHSHDFTLNRDVMDSILRLSADIQELNDKIALLEYNILEVKEHVDRL
jgi:hypothetical protein|tara:strand:+ start:43 stop:258 length:216 start_codon:yes stop_codon:yes gene_type:complete